ncbi:MAG: helix-turn-helix transcriptional regulator [Anaerolineae bacterium]|nr:helix-turn-helix transcriptional regulator [Anaerolineae bacterium]
MDNNTKEKLSKLAYYLKERYTVYIRSEIADGRPIPSQSDFAHWLGVNPASLSNWMNALRPPNPENVDAIASRLGLAVYQIMDLSPRVPNDKLFRQIVARWHKLSESQKSEIAERVVSWIDDTGQLESN